MTAKRKELTMQCSNLIVQALAGTGKTFTAVEGIKMMLGNANFSIAPSVQQKAIWSCFNEGKTPDRVCLAAFNVSIKDVMEEKLKEMHDCYVSTIHGLGLASIRNFLGRAGAAIKVNKKKTDHLLSTLHDGESAWNLSKSFPGYPAAVRRLVQVCKYKLWEDPTDEEITLIAAEYGVGLNSHADMIFDSVRKILELAALISNDEVDFDDMVWLPIRLGLPMTQYDLMVVDEGQDLNYCQQRITLKVGKRIIVIGDKNQAIYGFAGADTKSMDTMYYHLDKRDGCKELPLTVTRRCSFAVVEEAQKIVPEFQAHHTNSPGHVGPDTIDSAEPGDMVVCRTNAPLIGQAFQFINSNVPVNIIGSDISARLISLVKTLKADSTMSLVLKVNKHQDKEIARLNKQKYCPGTLIAAIEDRCKCLRIIARKVSTVNKVISTIKDLFTKRTGKSIRLSSIHRAKGLEAGNVFIMEPEKLPHPLATLDWEKEQEKNLKYVAVTRAVNNLTFVEKDECDE